MGMYTECFISCSIIKDAPPSVLEALSWMFNPATKAVCPPPDCPGQHPFFKCDRWQMVGTCSSYYFQPFPVNVWKHDEISQRWHLVSLSNLKNYGDEIEKFFDWIMPFIDEPEGQFIGYHRYEENDLPTLVVKTVATQSVEPNAQEPTK